jgi:flagellar motor switch protein FliN
MSKQDLDTDNLLNALAGHPAEPAPAAPTKAREPMQLLRRIPVRMTLEVGSATIPLADLLGLEHGSVIELDRLAGEPLSIKVNGVQIGRAEVVVSGENYGLRIVELDDLGTLAP